MNELNWLPLSYRKNVTLPRVIIEPYANQVYGGHYTLETQTIVAVEGDNIAATLAHEYRHHLQHVYGCTLVIVGIGQEDCDYDNYNTFIRRYFRSSWSEMDALLFEHKIAKSPVNHYWLNGLVTPPTTHSMSLYM